MKMQEAMNIINNKPKGFMVSLEWVKSGGILASDHFPDKHGGETLIPTEWEAWELADRFARVTRGLAVNIYVVDDTFKPVEEYKKRKIINR